MALQGVERPCSPRCVAADELWRLELMGGGDLGAGKGEWSDVHQHEGIDVDGQVVWRIQQARRSSLLTRQEAATFE